MPGYELIGPKNEWDEETYAPTPEACETECYTKSVLCDAWTFLPTEFNSKCQTIEENSDIVKDCVFPFRYKGKKYSTCTTFDSENGKAWCATKIDSNGNVVTGKWGDCLQGCFENKCRTEKGFDCVFPFKFKGRNYNKCTTDYSVNKKTWCATEVNSNGEVIDL